MSIQFTLPHIDISRHKIIRPFQAPPKNRGGGGAPRIREEHGKLLQAQLEASFQRADQSKNKDERLEPAEGVYLELELARKKNPDNLVKKKANIRPAAVKLEENENSTVALYVPNEARPILEKILRDYTEGPLTKRKQNPQRKNFVEPIEAIRQARLETFWTDDPAALPKNPQTSIWWEVWCFRNKENRIIEIVERLGARAADADNRLHFPETVVVPVLTNRPTIELLLFATFGVTELRRASTTPLFFTEEHRNDQYEWAQDLAERITWPSIDVPAVCLLDTGVNRAHILIEPALTEGDMTTVRENWGTADEHEPKDHGTRMAGLALHGDLTPGLVDESEYNLNHRLESVKILPPNEFSPNDPGSYGQITQEAVARVEISRPDRTRVICMAVTNENVSGSRPTTWSAAIDQAAAGVMPGDEKDAPRRLFLVSSGNAPNHIEHERILPANEYPIEDPAQAWNAITVGGYTDKINIAEEALANWQPMAAAGAISPYARTSVTWPQSKSPFKPEIVMEASNRAISPRQHEVLSVDSLQVLTTGSDTDRQPLSPFAGTSAATAQAARLAARLNADHPSYWPETIRALMIHSAEWTQAMNRELENAKRKRDRYMVLRRFGYGVPSYERATASAQNHLALIAQNEIQPFFKTENGRKFKHCHFYQLPWPRSVLENMGEASVRLKITLSYFVEPNPGLSSSIDPQRYQSYGLRFDLRRPLESSEDYKKRVNALEREDTTGRVHVAPEDGCWKFGAQSVSAGSLHYDEWNGSAVKLAARDIICIKPVIGWWRDRATEEICNKRTRYALVATLSTADVDLYTPISNLVDTDVDVEVSFGGEN